MLGGSVAANAAPSTQQVVTTTPPQDGSVDQVAELDASQLEALNGASVPAGAAGVAVRLDDSGKTVVQPLTEEELQATDVEWVATDR